MVDNSSSFPEDGWQLSRKVCCHVMSNVTRVGLQLEDCSSIKDAREATAYDARIRYGIIFGQTSCMPVDG